MKKQLIVFSICMMLVTIASVHIIGADENIGPILCLSDEEYNEFDAKISELNDQLLSASTIEQVEEIIRNVVVFLDEYGLLAEDKTIDEEVTLLKNAYLEQIQGQSGQTIVGETTIQEECLGSEINMGQTLVSPPGWNFLSRFPNPMSWGYRIQGWANDEMAYATKNFNKKRVSGYSTPAFLIIRGKISDGGVTIKLSVDWVYLVFGFGTFNVNCKYRTSDLKQYDWWIGTVSVQGFEAHWISGPTSEGYLCSEQQEIQDQQPSEQLIDATQQYISGDTTSS